MLDIGVSEDPISEKGWVIGSLNFLLHNLYFQFMPPFISGFLPFVSFILQKKSTHEMGIPCATPYTSIFHNSPPICLGFIPLPPLPPPLLSFIKG